MKMPNVVKLAVLMLFTGLTWPVRAADIDIKGICLGMTRDELLAQGATEKSPQKLVISGFTVGGVSATPGGEADLTLKDDRLETFTFFFAPTDFNEVLAAVKAKYARTKCENSELQNGFGAKFQQSYCTYSDGKTTLQLRRMVANELGLLSLVPNSTLKAMSDRSQLKKGDI